MSRVLGIKEIAFDCQPSATHCWGLEQPHQGHRAHFCFLCVHLSFIAGPHRLTALSGLGNDRSFTTLGQLPPALRSHCPWMSSGKFYTNALLLKCISVTVSPKVGGCGLGPPLAGGQEIGLCSLCAGILECSGTSQEFRQPLTRPTAIGLA